MLDRSTCMLSRRTLRVVSGGHSLVNRACTRVPYSDRKILWFLKLPCSLNRAHLFAMTLCVLHRLAWLRTGSGRLRLGKSGRRSTRRRLASPSSRLLTAGRSSACGLPPSASRTPTARRTRVRPPRVDHSQLGQTAHNGWLHLELVF